MLKVLLKKQLAEVFKGYFYDAKKNRMRSKGAVIAWFVFFGDGKFSSRHVKQRLADRTVSPGGEILVEQRRVIPDQRPCLCVVAQFLQLHGRHPASLMQNVFGYVKNRCFHICEKLGAFDRQGMHAQSLTA